MEGQKGEGHRDALKTITEEMVLAEGFGKC